MIGELNHVAIAVPDLNVACEIYQEQLGVQVSEKIDLPEHGVTVVFVNLPNTKIELLQPLGEQSPIHSYLKKNPAGGVHHLCYEVDDIHQAVEELQRQGLRVLGNGKPQMGAHNKPVVFLHPKDVCGTLIELEQV